MKDEQLRRLLNDAVSDVEPEDRLDELRASVRPGARVVHHLRARPWYAAAGIVAAVICLVAAITSVASNRSSETGFANPGSGGPTTIATDTAAPTSTPSGSTKAYAVYYVGTDPSDKPVLFREFHRGDASRSAFALALDGLQSRPLDPDYSTPWRASDILDVQPDPGNGVIYVTLGHRRLERRPARMTPDYARAAVQQVVYTVQAAYGKRLPVQFLIQSVPATTVLGVPAIDPIAQGKVLQTLSRISISNPNQGDTVSGDKLRVTGVNNGFEGTVAVYLEKNGHTFALKPTIGGTFADKLFPWEVTLNLSKVTPGTYTLVAQNDDASGRGNPEKDTRVITVQ